MRRDDRGGREQEADGRMDGFAASLEAAALLGDAVRHRIYHYVRRARRPVTRDEAAAAARVSRNLAAFHLDKLVQAGLLRAGIRPREARRAGRRPKLYEAGPVEVHVDIPPRQHGLLASVLVEAMTAGEGTPHGLTAVEAASRRGAAFGFAARLEAGEGRGAPPLRAVLEGLGFEPYDGDRSVLRLGNCPFRPVAAESQALVCGVNLALIGGVLTGLHADGVTAVLAPRAGECCVEIRKTGGSPPGQAA
jgi:predicted ArsR family transcriptional regulator